MPAAAMGIGGRGMVVIGCGIVAYHPDQRG